MSIRGGNLAPQHTLWGDKRGYHPDPSFFMKKKTIERISEHFDLKLSHIVVKLTVVSRFQPETEPTLVGKN